MGKNTIGNIVKKMAEKGNLSGRKVNHSCRKTGVAELVNSDIPPTTIMQLTGHKNIQSINDYNTVSLQQQKKMSNVMANIGSGTYSITEGSNKVGEQVVHVENAFDSDENFELANFEYEEISRVVEVIENVENTKISKTKKQL